MKKLPYLLTLFILGALLGFQNQGNQLFYYAFNRKVLLSEVENKLVVRYSPGTNKEVFSAAIRSAYGDLAQKWHDSRTVVITAESIANRDRIIKNFQGSKEVVVCHPVYKVNDDLEMITTDEFVVKFKPGIDPGLQLAIHKKYGTSIVNTVLAP